MAQDLNKKLAELSKQKGDAKKVAGEGKVIVKSGAYQTMLMHVLRFASSKMESSQWVEVMGVCMGKIEGNDVVIYDSIPISHGARVEVAWESADYAMFAGVDEQYASKGFFACSWYHSHPGLKTFLSKVDVKNHLFWQNEANPRAVAIVFDHNYLENPGDLGFRAFRLDDISRGVSSDYHEIEFTVEAPDKTTFFKTVKGIVEAGHKKDQSYVKELSETEWAGTVEEANKQGEGEVEGTAIPTVSPLTPTLDGFQTGIQSFANSFMKIFASQLEEWTGDTKKAVTKGVNPLVEVMESMRDAVQEGLNRIQNQFDSSLTKQVQSLEDTVTATTKKFEQGPGNIAGAIESASQELSQTLGIHVQTRFAEKIKEFEQVMSNTLGKLSDLGTSANNLAQALNSQGGKIKTVSTGVNDVISSINAKSQQSSEKVKSALNENGKNLVDLVENLKKGQDKLKVAAKDIEAKIKDIKALL